MPRPVYWKPKYATRGMRHRAWVRQQARHEERLKSLPHPPASAHACAPGSAAGV